MPPCLAILDFLWWFQGEHRSNLIFVNVKLPRARRLGFLALAVEHRVEELPGHLQWCFGIRDAWSTMVNHHWWYTWTDWIGTVDLWVRWHLEHFTVLINWHKDPKIWGSRSQIWNISSGLLCGCGLWLKGIVSNCGWGLTSRLCKSFWRIPWVG